MRYSNTVTVPNHAFIFALHYSYSYDTAIDTSSKNGESFHTFCWCWCCSLSLWFELGHEKIPTEEYDIDV